MQGEWVLRWRYWLSPEPVQPGVWRMKGGGFYVRGRVKDPLTGRMKELALPLPHASARDAYETLQRDLRTLREQLANRVKFGEYARALLERKMLRCELRSAQTKAHWRMVIERHLLPAFGEMELQDIRRAAIEAWKDEVAKEIRKGLYAPTTANDWLKTLRVIINTAVVEIELPRNPVMGVKDFDTSLHATYTEEEPNALTPDEVPLFLAEMRRRYPQHFAFVALGFATGLRPSSMRPLRRKGPKPDVRWDEGILLVRRSQTLGDEVMERTKTGYRQRLALPRELMDILRWHADGLPPGPMRDSDLLFPSETGGFRARSSLDKPFRRVGRAVGLTKTVTPRAMRRTFQDLARAAEVKDVVTRAISGHTTAEMQLFYSTVSAEEMRTSLAKVAWLAGVGDQKARDAIDASRGSEDSSPVITVG
jgi:integrase